MSNPDASILDLLKKARAGNEAALGRLLSFVEKGGTMAERVSACSFSSTGTAYTVGVTGAPGAGKSTLTSRLVNQLKDSDHRLAVLAIDPSSPWSGGAILGDRVRMAEHIADAKVFIRSMATRGNLGGLASATYEAIRVLDAAGFDWIVVETVGVGQVELDISKAADTTIVVLNPGWGDDVQAAKAGLLEIADLFVINKADREGADQTKRELGQMLDLKRYDDGWDPPVTMAIAIDGQGVQEISELVQTHREWLTASGKLEARRRERLWSEVECMTIELITARAKSQLLANQQADLCSRLEEKSVDPVSAAHTLADHYCGE